MSKKLIVKPEEQKLKESKAGSGYFQYEYTTNNPEAIIEDFKHDFGIEPKKGWIAVYKKGNKLSRYIRKAGWMAIANALKIKTLMDKPQFIKNNSGLSVIVKCTAVLLDGTSHEAWGYSDTTEAGRNTPNKALSMAMTHARINALSVASEDPSCPFEDWKNGDPQFEEAYDAMDAQICPKCGDRGWHPTQKRCLLCLVTYEEILAEKEAAE